MRAAGVHVGEVVRNAVVFDFKNRGGDVVNADSLFEDAEGSPAWRCG